MICRVLRGSFCFGLVLCAGAVWAEAKPEVKAKSISYVVAGHAASVTLYGENLTPVSVKANKAHISVKLGAAKATEGDDKKKGSRQVTLDIVPAVDCPPDSVELTLAQADGGKALTQIAVVPDAAQEIKEVKPNGTFAQAMPLASDKGTVAVSGHVDGDSASSFRLDAHAGDVWRIGLFAGRGGSLLDPVLRVRDSRHMSLAIAAGDAKKDLSLAFTAPANGTYYIEIMDAESKGGGEYTFRLLLQPPQPTSQPKPVSAQP